MSYLFIKRIIIISTVVSLCDCSFSNNEYILETPLNLEREEHIRLSRVCLIEAKEKSHILLTENENNRVKNIETARYFEGGRGHNTFSDRYILCFLNNGFKVRLNK